jgi:hypothetical protein
MIKQAEKEEEVITIRCVRKTEASKPGGPDIGELYDLQCTAKPKSYKCAPSGMRRRRNEDDENNVLTVFVVNRKDANTGRWGAWRRVNLACVQKVIYKTLEYEVIQH